MQASLLLLRADARTVTSNTTIIQEYPIANEQFHRVLCTGLYESVLQYLSLKDIMQLLATCSLCRKDHRLAFTILLHTGVGHHFVHGCHNAWVTQEAYRWMHVSPCREARMPIVERPLYAPLISMVAFIEQHLLRWCFPYDASFHTVNTEYDVLCQVRPALLPLSTVSNADAFSGNEAPASRFGMHWDHIQYDPRTRSMRCALCDAAEHAIMFYRQQVHLFCERYHATLMRRQTEWLRQQLDVPTIARRSAALQAKYFPFNAYLVHDAHQWNDAQVLAHVVHHGRFQPPPAVSAVMTPDQVGATLSHTYRHQCRTFYRPLKKRLKHQFADCRRMTQADVWDGFDTELVAGISQTTGMLCGLSVTFRLTN